MWQNNYKGRCHHKVEFVMFIITTYFPSKEDLIEVLITRISYYTHTETTTYNQVVVYLLTQVYWDYCMSMKLAVQIKRNSNLNLITCLAFIYRVRYSRAQLKLMRCCTTGNMQNTMSRWCDIPLRWKTKTSIFSGSTYVLMATVLWQWT